MTLDDRFETLLELLKDAKQCGDFESAKRFIDVARNYILSLKKDVVTPKLGDLYRSVDSLSRPGDSPFEIIQITLSYQLQQPTTKIIRYADQFQLDNRHKWVPVSQEENKTFFVTTEPEPAREFPEQKHFVKP